MRQSRRHASARRTNLLLLVRRQHEHIAQSLHIAGDLAAVVSPGECRPRSALAELVTQITSLLKLLIVIDAKHASVDRRVENQAALLRSEESRARMPHGHERRETM